MSNNTEQPNTLDINWDEIEQNYGKNNRRHSSSSSHRSHRHHSSSGDHRSHSHNSSNSNSSGSRENHSSSRRNRLHRKNSFGATSHKAGNKTSKPKKKWSRKKKILVGILVFLFAIVVGLTSAYFVLRYIGRCKLTNYDNLNLNLPKYVDYEDGGNVVYYKGHKYVFNKSIATILFMGVDNRKFSDLKKDPYAFAGQADALYLFTYDTNTNRMRVLCLNRDTMTDINRYDTENEFVDTKTMQLCLAYAYGDGRRFSAENQVTACQRLIYNIPINGYYTIDLSAIKILNDDIGGVTVTPEYSFGKFVKGQTVTLHGDDAESFVRTRDVTKLDDNIRRMACQRTYIQNFASAIAPAIRDDFQTPFRLYSDSSKYTLSNIGISGLTFLASDLALNYPGMEMIKTEGKYTLPKNKKAAQFKLKERPFFEQVLDLFYTRAD